MVDEYLNRADEAAQRAVHLMGVEVEPNGPAVVAAWLDAMSSDDAIEALSRRFESLHGTDLSTAFRYQWLMAVLRREGRE